MPRSAPSSSGGGACLLLGHGPYRHGAGSIGEGFYRHWIRALNWLEDMPKVSLAVLHGHSIGGGLQLGLACDVVWPPTTPCSPRRFRHGIIPDGAVLRLARVIGLAGPRSWRCSTTR